MSTSNTFPLGLAYLGAPSALLNATPALEDISFNGYGLQNDNIVISNFSWDTPPTRKLDASARPLFHGEIYNSAWYRRRIITVTGKLSASAIGTSGSNCAASTTSGMTELVDTFKAKVLFPEQGNLIIKMRDGSYRTFVATAINTHKAFKQDTGSYVSFLPFQFQFAVLDPFGYSYTAQSVARAAVNTIKSNTVLTMAGSGVAKPKIYIQFVSVAALTTLKIENLANNRSMQLDLSTATIGAGSLLVIDCENLKVTLNNVDIDFDGRFPFLDPGANNMEINTTSTNHEFNLSYVWNDSYL